MDESWADHACSEDARSYWSPVRGDPGEEQLDVEEINEMVAKACAEEEAADAVQEEVVANAGCKGRGKGARTKANASSHLGTAVRANRAWRTGNAVSRKPRKDQRAQFAARRGAGADALSARASPNGNASVYW